MNYQEFLEAVKNRLEICYGQGISISFRTVIKNNNVKMDGLIIKSPDQSVVPTIYMHDFYVKYENGEDIDNITRQIILTYETALEKERLNISDISSYEKIKGNIIYRLVKLENNEEYLKNTVYDVVMDFAKCYCIVLPDMNVGYGTMMIKNSQLAFWDVSKEEVRKQAEKNTPKLFKSTLIPMSDVLRELTGIESDDDDGMYVLTNTKRFLGSSTILYEGLLKGIADELEADLYVLPSSIHEVIIVKKDALHIKNELRAMVRCVNDREVAADEILSYSVYEFDRKNDILHM